MNFSSKVPFHFSVYKILSALLVFAFAVGLGIFFFNKSAFLSLGGYGNPESISGLRGQLEVTLTAAGLVSPYIFDFDKGKLIRQSRTAGELLLQATVATTTKNTAYRCLSKEGVAQVCVYRADTGIHATISHNAFPLKRYLAWSPDEKSVLYVASLNATTTPASVDPGEWAVFLAQADGSSEMRVATGSVAFFSPDGAAIFSLQKDGIHEYNLASSTNKVVLPATGEVMNRFMTVAVSYDGSKLAVADPHFQNKKGRLAVYTVTSWNPFIANKDSEVSLRVWQMQFSPDGKALALSADSSEGQPGLYVYRLGGEPSKFMDLQAYERKTFLSGWK